MIHKQCPKQGVPYLVGDSKTQQKRKIFKGRCGQWDCPYCAEINRSQHYNRVANGIHFYMREGIEFQFVTITCHENWRGTHASIKNWRKNKDKLLARYRRRYKKDTDNPCHYVYIPETHKDETLHIHGIFSGNFGSRWWKDNARESGLGYMAESEGLRGVLQAVNYINKYITKEIGKAQIIKNFRRISYSQGFRTISRHETDYDWRVLDRETSIESAIVEGLVRMNYDVEFDGRNWNTDDFLTDDVTDVT